MFAVTGITGKVGAAVARSLLSADQPVRAVVRDRSRGAPWAQLGCDIAVADLSDTEALTAAFAGTAGVFAMVPPVFDPAPGFPEATGFINSLRAALGRAKPGESWRYRPSVRMRCNRICSTYSGEWRMPSGVSRCQ